jgi:endonuclease/exonuclease/phosphatase family metal-dependent hydrolase
VVTWNVRSLRDDEAVVVHSLVRLRPQIVLLQETPRLWRGDRRLASLAGRTRLRVVGGGARAHGVAILAALEASVDHTNLTTLSRTPKLHRRGVVLADVCVAGARLVAGSLHLGLSHAERVRHVEEVAGLLRDVAAAAPCVIGMDTNEPPGGAVTVSAQATWGLREVLAEEPTAAATYPARSARERIDQIWVSPQISVRRAGVPQLPALERGSDHLPVVAELAVPRTLGERAGWGGAR